MFSHDACGFFRLRIAGVVAELKRAAQKKRIGAREHIQITVAAADREVVDVRVRGHVNQLTFGRCDLRIVKQRRSAESRAVEENFSGRAKISSLQLKLRMTNLPPFCRKSSISRRRKIAGSIIMVSSWRA